MKRVLLLRHAKAVAKNEAHDFERALAPEGRTQLVAVAAYLGGEAPRPDRALVSPSRRTRETWDLASVDLGDVATTFDRAIYEGEEDELLKLVQTAGDAGAPGDTLILVGHNPGISDLAVTLAGEGDLRAKLDRGMPTGALAILEFDVSQWRDIAPGGGRLTAYMTPTR